MKKIIRLTESDLHNIIKESASKLLTESQESKSQSEAIKLVMDKLGYDYEQANNFVRKDLRNEITSLRDKNIAKFTLGVARMYCDRQITDANTISDLNATLKLLSAHINEYDRNLNGISTQELINKFAQTRRDNIDAEKNEIESLDFSQGSRYKIVPINSFEEAQKYYKYTNPDGPWCLTHMEDMFESYTSNGINQIYFCLREGFEDEPYEIGDNAPLDDYGLSMLSIIVNENGELAYCTTRWNHDNGGTDSAMTAKEVSQVVGVNFYEVFKPNNKWNDLLSNAIDMMSRGVPYENIFDEVYNFNNGFAMVTLNDKCNFINTNGELISDQWFNGGNDFCNGFARVKLNNKYNFINTNGEFISNQWFDGANDFRDGFAWVKLNGNYNLINTNGELVSDQWFDWFGDFHNGFAKVKLNGKCNYINTNGELISNQWFDWGEGFHEGFGCVKLNGKFNYISTNGEFISNQWFDGCGGDFYKGFAYVKLNGKNYKIDTNGKLYNLNENKTYKMKNTIRITESDLYQIIKESVSNILSESRNIKSEKLYNIINQHNGIKSNRGVFDIHNMTDDDIINVINSKELSDFEKLGSKRFAQKYNIELGIADQIDYIPLNDGNYILAKCRGARYDRIGKQHNANREKQSGDFEHLVNKKKERKENRYPRKEDYVWNNDDARDVFHNPYFRKGEGNWTPERKQQVMNNIRKGKKWFDI